MEITGTRAAFEAVLNTKGAAKKLGIKAGTLSSLKNRLESGQVITLDKMEEVLALAGAVVIQDKVYRIDL